ncbi:MAG: hypothetical protein CM1200mP30_09140 [Pseudomonadota bacterium]|nr:MAG: hypothetical protein CM1200mP30_09140 [Pseudomonadota bacterium]
MISTLGDKYVGEFKNGIFHGQGTYTLGPMEGSSWGIQGGENMVRGKKIHLQEKSMSVIGGVTFFMVKELIPGQMEENSWGIQGGGKTWSGNLHFCLWGRV